MDVVIMNEQHTLLPAQEALLSPGFEIEKIPADGLTAAHQAAVVDRLVARNVRIVFLSPVPLMLAKASAFMGNCEGRAGSAPFSVALFHNDRREKKELPGGKVISVVAAEGWQLINI